MATVTTPLPGVSASRRNQPTARERRERSTQQSLDNWMKRNMKTIVNALCVQMFDHGTQDGSYTDLTEFYVKYADYVISRERVKSPDDRVRLLALVLGHAKAVGRVVVHERELGLGVTIKLSGEEAEKHLERVHDREAAKEARRVANCRRKQPRWMTG